MFLKREENLKFSVRLSAFLALFVSTAFVAALWAAPEVYTVKVPEKLGRVKERYQGKSDFVVVHIQDAHSNLEAQKNLGSLVNLLVNHQEFNLVGVEGAPVEKVNLEPLRLFPFKDAKQTVGNAEMAAGRLGGAEYAAITSEKAFDMTGLEDQSLFNQDFQAFINAARGKDDILEQLEEVEQILNQLRTPIYATELARLDQTITDYTANKIDFLKYYLALNTYAEQAKLDFAQYIHFLSFKEVAILGSNIDFTKLDSERKTLVDELRADLLNDAQADGTNPKLEQFDKFAKQYEEGSIPAKDYYKYLRALAYDKNVNQRRFPNVFLNTSYLEAYAKVDVASLVEECKTVSLALVDHFAASSDAKLLFKEIKAVQTLKMLMGLKAVSEDLHYYQAHKEDFTSQAILGLADRLVKQTDLKVQVPQAPGKWEAALPGVEHFYALADQRSHVMVDNLLKQAQSDKTNKAVIVAGGFHTDGIAENLRERGVSYIIVTPAISKVADDVPYFDAMLKASSAIQPQVSFIRLSQLLTNPRYRALLLSEMAAQAAIDGTRVPDLTLDQIIAAAMRALASTSPDAPVVTEWAITPDGWLVAVLTAEEGGLSPVIPVVAVRTEGGPSQIPAILNESGFTPASQTPPVYLATPEALGKLWASRNMQQPAYQRPPSPLVDAIRSAGLSAVQQQYGPNANAMTPDGVVVAGGPLAGPALTESSDFAKLNGLLGPALQTVPDVDRLKAKFVILGTTPQRVVAIQVPQVSTGALLVVPLGKLANVPDSAVEAVNRANGVVIPVQGSFDQAFGLKPVEAIVIVTAQADQQPAAVEALTNIDLGTSILGVGPQVPAVGSPTVSTPARPIVQADAREWEPQAQRVSPALEPLHAFDAVSDQPVAPRPVSRPEGLSARGPLAEEEPVLGPREAKQGGVEEPFDISSFRSSEVTPATPVVGTATPSVPTTTGATPTVPVTPRAVPVGQRGLNLQPSIPVDESIEALLAQLTSTIQTAGQPHQDTANFVVVFSSQDLIKLNKLGQEGTLALAQRTCIALRNLGVQVSVVGDNAEEARGLLGVNVASVLDTTKPLPSNTILNVMASTNQVAGVVSDSIRGASTQLAQSNRRFWVLGEIKPTTVENGEPVNVSTFTNHLGAVAVELVNPALPTGQMNGILGGFLANITSEMEKRMAPALERALQKMNATKALLIAA